MPSPPNLIPFVPAPEWSAADALPSPRRGKDSFGMVRFVGMTPRRPQKLKAIGKDLAPKECFSARDIVHRGTALDRDIVDAQPKSVSAREASTRKVLAIDLDIGLCSSKSICTEATGEATKKSKERKDAVAKLKTQVRRQEQHLEDVKAEIETAARATAKVKASFENLHAEHAILQARHTWAKSSLDSALSTQEEYKRHYESVEASLAKAKLELACQEELLKSAGKEDASSVIDKAKAELSLREEQLGGELIMVEQTKRLTVLKLKDNSRAILECMAATQERCTARMAFQHWIHAVQQARVEAQKAEHAIATQHLLRQFKDRRRQLAFSSAERLVSASQSSLASITLRAWAQQAQEASMMASVSPFRALLRGCSNSPRPATSRSSGLRKADVRGPQDNALKQCQSKHRGKAAYVLQHLADEEEAALVSQVLCCWSKEASEAKIERNREVEAQATLAGLEATLQALRETLRGKTEELEAVDEEVEDMNQKNREVLSACKEIIELQKSVAVSLNEIEATVDEE